MTEEILAQCKRYVEENDIRRTRRVVRMPRFRSFKMCEIDTNAAQEYLNNHREISFVELLFSHIDNTGKKDSEIYKKAFIDRRLFSKMRSNPAYTPTKKTALALCFALELSRADADQLLSAAGHSLSRAEDYDLIMAFCLERKIFNLTDVNDILYHFGLETF